MQRPSVVDSRIGSPGFQPSGASQPRGARPQNFAMISTDDVFHRIIQKYFDGARDPRSIELIGDEQ